MAMPHGQESGRGSAKNRAPGTSGVIVAIGRSDTVELAERLGRIRPGRVAWLAPGRLRMNVRTGLPRLAADTSPAGIAEALSTAGAGILIDGCHPFDEEGHLALAEGARAAGVRLARFDRLPWTPAPGEHWREVAAAEVAAALLPPGARVFLAVGRALVAPFHARSDVMTFARRLDPTVGPDVPAPNGGWIDGPGPFSVAEEEALFRRLGITHLVAKNTGARQGRTKVTAACRLGIETILLAPPPPASDVPVFTDPEALIGWIEGNAA